MALGTKKKSCTSNINENNMTTSTKFFFKSFKIVYHLKTATILKKERQREAELKAVFQVFRIHPDNSSANRLQQAPRHQCAVRPGGHVHPEATVQALCIIRLVFISTYGLVKMER